MKFSDLEVQIIKGLLFDEVLMGVADWKKAYNILNPETDNKYINDYCSHWKKKSRVQNLYNNLKQQITAKIDFNYNSVVSGDNNEIDLNNSNKLDYTKRLNIINFLNKQLNTISDDKQKLDYIKTLIDLLRLKEDQNGKTNDIQRFYTVITCSNCELYKAKQAEINNNSDPNDTI